MEKDSKFITAITFLEKLIEFNYLTQKLIPGLPDFDDSIYEVLKKNPQQWIMLQQIKIMIKVFIPELTEDDLLYYKTLSIFSGKFIKLRNIENYQTAFAEIDTLIGKTNRNNSKHIKWNLQLLEKNYQAVFVYRREIKGVWVNLSYLRKDTDYCYSELLTNAVTESININSLNEFLGIVIDPQKRVFLKEDLIKHYNYPS